MISDCLRPPHQLPEWQRSGPFLLLAIALHAALLFYPVKIAISRLEEAPPNSVTVRLEQAHPAPSPARPVALPKPQPPAMPPPKPRPRPAPRPVLAMTPEQTSAPATVTAPAPAPLPVAAPFVPAAAPAASPAPVATLSPARFDAAYLENPPPSYPPLSRRRGEQGKVLLRVRVSPDGQAAAVDIEKSSNFERLDEAARRAISRWRFIPAKRGETAIEATVIVPFVFRLEN